MAPGGREWYDMCPLHRQKGDGLEWPPEQGLWKPGRREILTWRLAAQSVVLQPEAWTSLGAFGKCRIRLHFNWSSRPLTLVTKSKGHSKEQTTQKP
jgi:hypothetical protein